MKKNSTKKKEWKSEYRAFVREVVSVCRFKMFLGIWNIDISYEKEAKTSTHEERDTLADIDVNDRYYEAKINIYPPTHKFWDKGDKRKIVEVVVHELAHIIVTPVSKMAEMASSPSEQRYCTDRVEQLTQHISTIVIADLERESSPLLK